MKTARDECRKLALVCKQWQLKVLQCQWFCQTEQHFLCAVSLLAATGKLALSAANSNGREEIWWACMEWRENESLFLLFKIPLVSRFPNDMNYINCVWICHCLSNCMKLPVALQLGQSVTGLCPTRTQQPHELEFKQGDDNVSSLRKDPCNSIYCKTWQRLLSNFPSKARPVFWSNTVLYLQMTWKWLTQKLITCKNNSRRPNLPNTAGKLRQSSCLYDA